MSSTRTVPATIATGTLMYLFAVGVRSALSNGLFANPNEISPALMRFASYAALAAIAIVAMAIGARHNGWRRYGFRAARGGWWPCTAVAVVAGVLSSVLVKVGHGSGLDAAMAGIGPATLIAMVVVATLVEELFVRGWMLGALEPIAARVVRVGRYVVSVRVLTGAVFFGAMHVTLAKTPIDGSTFAVILGFTIVLGIFCGVARERSGSLLPAIATHFAGNLGGLLGGVLYVLATGVPPTSM